MTTVLCKPATISSTPFVVGQSVEPQGGEAVPPAQESERSDTSDEEERKASGNDKTNVRRYPPLVAMAFCCVRFCLGSRTFPFRKRNVKFGTPPSAGQDAQGNTPSLRNLIQGRRSSCEDASLAFFGSLLSVSPDIAEFGRQLMAKVGERTMRSIESGELSHLSWSPFCFDLFG